MITLALQYSSTYSGSLILIAFYFCLFIYFLVYSYYRPIKFFRSRYLMYFNVAKKVILAILVCLPISPFVLPILLMGCAILEVLVEWRMQRINRRIVVGRGLEMLAELVLVVYIAVENNRNTAS